MIDFKQQTMISADGRETPAETWIPNPHVAEEPRLNSGGNGRGGWDWTGLFWQTWNGASGIRNTPQLGAPSKPGYINSYVVVGVWRESGYIPDSERVQGVAGKWAMRAGNRALERGCYPPLPNG